MEINAKNLMAKAREYRQKARDYVAMDQDDMTATRYESIAEEAENAAWALGLGSAIAVPVEDTETMLANGCTQKSMPAGRQFTQYDEVSNEMVWVDRNGKRIDPFEFEGRSYYPVLVYPASETPANLQDLRQKALTLHNEAATLTVDAAKGTVDIQSALSKVVEIGANIDGIHQEAALLAARVKKGRGLPLEPAAIFEFARQARDMRDELSEIAAGTLTPDMTIIKWSTWLRQTEDDLNAIMTAGEAVEAFGLSADAVNLACRRGSIPSRKSGGTWLIRRADAVRRWGSHKKQSIEIHITGEHLSGDREQAEKMIELMQARGWNIKYDSVPSWFEKEDGFPTALETEFDRDWEECLGLLD